MRVKVRNSWYFGTIGCAMMVELTEQDKENIANMPSNLSRYAVFDEDDPNFNAEYKKIKWMKE